MIGVATATLNLDTTVAFLTPVLAHTARNREGARLPCCRGACCCPMRARCSWSARTSEPDRPGPAAPQRRGLPSADVGPGAGRPRGYRRGSRARCRHAGTRRPVPAHPQHDQWGPRRTGPYHSVSRGLHGGPVVRRGQAGAVPGNYFWGKAGSSRWGLRPARFAADYLRLENLKICSGWSRHSAVVWVWFLS
jgi:hypothetical protein